MMPLALDQIDNASTEPTDIDLPAPGVWANLGALIFRGWLAVSVAVCGILGLPVLLLGSDAVRWFCRQWARSVLVALRVCCHIRHDVSGIENLPKGPAIVAANHQSMWETVWLFSHLEKPVVIVKQELISVPLFGFWLRQTGAIAVDRESGPKSIRILIKSARAAINAGSQIVIFPEGTRVKPGNALALKPGIAGIYAACEAPVTAVGHDSGLYWLYPGWQKRSGIIRMQIATPIEVGLDRATFLDRLELTLNANRPDLKTIGHNHAVARNES